MSIAITGGAGFIGTRLCDRLDAAGRPFRVIDSRESRRFGARGAIADIRDQAALRPALDGADAIVHLAAVHRDDVRPRSLYDAVNVDGTSRVAEAAEALGIERIVFTSSVAVYGFAAPGTGEDGPVAPFNDYGRTKADAEEVLRAWQARAPDRRSLVIVRPTVVFGEGNRGNVHTLLSQIAAGRFVMVGPGHNRKSMAYVGNVAAFLEHALGLGPGVHLHNYVDGPDLTMDALVRLVRRRLTGADGVGLRLPLWAGRAAGHGADMVARLTGVRLPVSAIRVRKFCAETSFTASAHAVPGFRAPVALADALERTIVSEFVRPDPAREIFVSE